jgi:hypothetical protein
VPLSRIQSKEDEMPYELPVTGVVPISQMIGDDEEETRLLHGLLTRAQAFLSSFAWCVSISELYFGEGIGGIFGVFFAHIHPSRTDIDTFLWIIVGDIPSAYLVTDRCKTPSQAIRAYIEEIRKWVELARQGKTSSDVIPVNVPATPEWAEILGRRLNTLEQEILPQWLPE